MLSTSQLPSRFRRSATTARISLNLKSNNSSRVRHQSSRPPLHQEPLRTRARLSRILDRLPSFLQPYTRRLRSAPLSHLTSFLILHELTAIIPLLGLTGLFHYTGVLASFGHKEGEEQNRWGKYVEEGTERFGAYFGRKGWFGFSRREDMSREASEEGAGENSELGIIIGPAEGIIPEQKEMVVERRWHVGEKGGKILVEVATAYAITKVLLPVRIVVSVWGTPWFARAVLGRFSGLFGRGKSAVVKSVENTQKRP